MTATQQVKLEALAAEWRRLEEAGPTRALEAGDARRVMNRFRRSVGLPSIF